MKQLTLLLLLISFIFFCNHSHAQLAPGSLLTDGTDEAFLESLTATGSYGTLIFRMSTDGNMASDFHAACDNQGPTLVIMRNSISGEVFGGYSRIDWAGSGYSTCGDCVLFNLTHDYSLENNIFPQWSIFRNSTYGPTFGGGHDLHVPNVMDGSGGYCNDHSYEYPTAQGYNFLHGGSAQGDMTIDEIEVYLILNAFPVELTHFEGKKQGLQIELNWVTESELNNSGFEIQKSPNGRDWDAIEFIDGQGTSNEINKYHFLDKNPILGINYYRLRQIDFNQQFEFSKVIAVEYQNHTNHIRVFPNPSTGMVNLHFDNPIKHSTKVTISDSVGRKVWESKTTEGASEWSKTIAINESGIYFISVQIGKELYHKRLIVSIN